MGVEKIIKMFLPSVFSKKLAIEYNVLRLCDGRIENLIINRDVSAAIAKPLLAAGLSHKLK